MKQIPALMLLLLLCGGISAFAGESGSDKKDIPEIRLDTEELAGKAKAGLALGYPFGLTFAYRPAERLEINALAGTHYDGLTLGGSLLFTLAVVNIQGELFPLSLGPALYARIGKEFGLTGGAALRWEYSFTEIPLNLYVEAVPGVNFIDETSFYMGAAAGVRYIF